MTSRVENLKAALEISKCEYDNIKKSITSQETAMSILLLGVILMCIPLVMIYEIATKNNGIVSYILNQVFLGLSIASMISTIVFSMLGLFHRRNQIINMSSYLKCNFDEDNYLLNVLFEYEQISKKNLKSLKSIKKHGMGAFISFVLVVSSFICFIISNMAMLK